VVSAVSNIWGAQKGVLSAASKLVLFVTGGATVFFVILWIIYKPILLGDAKKKHIGEAGHHLGLGQYGEGRIQARESVQGPGTRIANTLSAGLSYGNQLS
jgi:hypothetical protein